MNLKESDCLLLELAHLSIDKDNSLIDHDNIWKAFKIGIEYQKNIIKKKGNRVITKSNKKEICDGLIIELKNNEYWMHFNSGGLYGSLSMHSILLDKRIIKTAIENWFKNKLNIS